MTMGQVLKRGGGEERKTALKEERGEKATGEDSTRSINLGPGTATGAGTQMQRGRNGVTDPAWVLRCGAMGGGQGDGGSAQKRQ